MFDKVLELIAPHHCYYCLEKPYVLCGSCIYNIKDEAKLVCFGCSKPSLSGICTSCTSRLPFSRAWHVGERKDELKAVLDDFKFQRLYSGFRPLALLLSEVLPILPGNTVIVPIPTISHHVRIRGYDQTHLIAREVAKIRGLRYKNYLRRKTNKVQTGASKRLRKQQANKAFYCGKALNSANPYLLIDDISTTGATLNAAASEVWVAVIAKQPYESTNKVQ